MGSRFCFRPLAGIRVFRTRDPWRLCHLPRRVSVPWRGLGSFGHLDNPDRPLRPNGFRPLAGIRVFRTRARPDHNPRSLPVSVPWRGLGSFGLTAPPADALAAGVSVPWRGLGSFGPPARLVALDQLYSFRPLAGIRVFRTRTGGGTPKR